MDSPRASITSYLSTLPGCVGLLVGIVHPEISVTTIPVSQSSPRSCYPAGHVRTFEPHGQETCPSLYVDCSVLLCWAVCPTHSVRAGGPVATDPPASGVEIVPSSGSEPAGSVIRRRLHRAKARTVARDIVTNEPVFARKGRRPSNSRRHLGLGRRPPRCWSPSCRNQAA